MSGPCNGPGVILRQGISSLIGIVHLQRYLSCGALLQASTESDSWRDVNAHHEVWVYDRIIQFSMECVKYKNISRRNSRNTDWDSYNRILACNIEKIWSRVRNHDDLETHKPKSMEPSWMHVHSAIRRRRQDQLHKRCHGGVIIYHSCR